LDPEVGRVCFMRVDQYGWNAGAAEHRGGGRAGEPPADNRNVGVAHRAFLRQKRQIAARAGKKALAEVIKVYLTRVNIGFGDSGAGNRGPQWRGAARAKGADSTGARRPSSAVV